MTPQSQFMINAPLRDGAMAKLRELLRTMTRRPGMADPGNALLAFGSFDKIHFARFVVLDDQTQGDIAQCYPGQTVTMRPPSLAFLVDCDGGADAMMAEIVDRAGAGLRRIFSHCEDFDDSVDLLAWMRARRAEPVAYYVNWLGRTVRQCREESALHAFLRSRLSALADAAPQAACAALKAAASEALKSGQLTLSPEAPTPFFWWLGNKLNLIGFPLILVLLSPLLILYLPLFFILLRYHEIRDPVFAPKPAQSHTDALAAIEDFGITNQFSAIGTLKPGWFRRSTAWFLLTVLDYVSRHILNRGALARVRTIHFARWVYVDGNRILFASNYDGSLESYMDDFINKAGFGLNLVFSNGVGYPRTNWLICDGAGDEQKFKYFLRRHELPTEVWYNALPGLTAFDLSRDGRIRRGLERAHMSGDEARQWLALI